jgi:hypothetical protein
MRPGTRLLAAVATAVALACPPASAQEARTFYTGNNLLSLCTSNGVLETGVCRGFVGGIADAMALDPILGNRACIPVPVTLGQARDVVIRFLEQHPEARHYSAASIVALALAAAFPCKP